MNPNIKKTSGLFKSFAHRQKCVSKHYRSSQKTWKRFRNCLIQILCVQKADHAEIKPIISFVADICEAEAIAQAFENVDVVFHCAAYINFEFPSNLTELERVNVNGMFFILCAGPESGPKRWRKMVMVRCAFRRCSFSISFAVGFCCCCFALQMVRVPCSSTRGKCNKFRLNSEWQKINTRTRLRLYSLNHATPLSGCAAIRGRPTVISLQWPMDNDESNARECVLRALCDSSH